MLHTSHHFELSEGQLTAVGILAMTIIVTILAIFG